MSDRQELTRAEGDGWLSDRFSAAWGRLAPLSTGAVAGGLVIVGATTLLRRLLGVKYRRAMNWGGALTFIPLGLWLFLRGEAREVEPDEEIRRQSRDA